MMWLVLLLLVPQLAAAQAPNVEVLLSYRDDHNRGIVWTGDTVVKLLQDHPNAYLSLGSYGSGYPIGSPVRLGLGTKVDEFQAAIASYNAAHDPDLPTGRICADWRPDLTYKHIDGTSGTDDQRKWCGSLLGWNQCSPTPCRDYPDNPCTRWEGDMAKDWGTKAAAFDTDWLLRTDQWDAVVARSYEGEDFCDGAGHSWSWTTHKEAICAANKPGEKVVLYGKSSSATKRIAFVSGVGFDIRQEQAREWQARYLLSSLLDMGFQAGEPACVILGAKPGGWSYYDGPNPSRPCAGDNPRSWTGSETPENADRCWGGNLVPTPYGPGEYETALNEQLRVLWRLAGERIPERGRVDGRDDWGTINIITTERPEARGVKWSIWDADVKRRLLGEMNNRPTGLEP